VCVIDVSIFQHTLFNSPSYPKTANAKRVGSHIFITYVCCKNQILNWILVYYFLSTILIIILAMNFSEKYQSRINRIHSGCLLTGKIWKNGIYKKLPILGIFRKFLFHPWKSGIFMEFSVLKEIFGISFSNLNFVSFWKHSLIIFSWQTSTIG